MSSSLSSLRKPLPFSPLKACNTLKPPLVIISLRQQRSSSGLGSLHQLAAHLSFWVYAQGSFSQNTLKYIYLHAFHKYWDGHSRKIRPRFPGQNQRSETYMCDCVRRYTKILIVVLSYLWLVGLEMGILISFFVFI